MAPWLSTIIATVVGGALAILGGYLVGLKQRAWQKEQALFERQLSITRTLDEALVETERRILNREIPDGENRWEAARREWEEAWVRVSPFLVNPDVKDRYEAVGRMLSDLVLYEGDARMGRQSNAALRATLNARQAIAYFGREESLPMPCFPSADHLTLLLGEGDPDPLLPDAPLPKWLGEHPVPPWHPEQRD